MNRFTYTLRKYPAARIFTLVLFIASGVFLLTTLTRSVLHKPVLKEINSPVGLAGDVLVLKGDFFGKSRDSSYVELCGNRLTESSYISWSNNEIKVIVPGNTEDGLVFVVNRGGKSNPEFFANESAIPVYMPENPLLRVPIISELSTAVASTGQVLVITGRNFGASRGDSNIYFSGHKENITEESVPDLTGAGVQNEPARPKYSGFVSPSESDYDFEYWSDTEIRIRVPDGAVSGSVFVVTGEGRSVLQPFTVKNRIGEKTFKNRHTYLVQVGADLYNIQGTDNGAVTIHLPHPISYSLQTDVVMTETIPEPSLLEYRGNSIFQITPADRTSVKNTSTAHQNFVVSCSGLETQINRDYTARFKETSRMLYRTYTRSDDIIPSNRPEVQELLPKIYSTVKNPYRQAELIYNYMISNFKADDKVRSGDSDPLDLISRKRGDAYDFAVVFGALTRASGIPCRVLSGILVDSDKQTRCHWWNEFYIENFGWVPVDTALGAGLEFKAFQNEQTASDYYFGNIDAQHIAFSDSYKVIKQSLLNNKLVSIPRSFALQSIWEESSGDVESYSSYWHTPSVLGIY